MTKQEEIAQFIKSAVLVTNIYGYDFASSGLPDERAYENQPTIDDFGTSMVSMTEFRALQLGTWLGSTDGQVIIEAVEMVLPPIYRPQIEFLADGLQYAAKLQQREGQKKAGGVAVAVLLIGAMLWAAGD
jgi:hypothetical protein